MTEACIWCGHEPLNDTTHETVYACGTVQHPRSDVWSQSAGCMEIMRSRNRIKRAVEVLEGGERIMMMLDEDDEDVSFVVPATDVDRSIGILGGEEDEQAD